jgi:ApbE superfamily uncharacterized protein (UPF0280 family)
LNKAAKKAKLAKAACVAIRNKVCSGNDEEEEEEEEELVQFDK